MQTAAARVPRVVPDNAEAPHSSCTARSRITGQGRRRPCGPGHGRSNLRITGPRYGPGPLRAQDHARAQILECSQVRACVAVLVARPPLWALGVGSKSTTRTPFVPSRASPGAPFRGPAPRSMTASSSLIIATGDLYRKSRLHRRDSSS
jgi:hypothetical protein